VPPTGGAKVLLMPPSKDGATHGASPVVRVTSRIRDRWGHRTFA
jgi:hypothetical protein